MRGRAVPVRSLIVAPLVFLGTSVSGCGESAPPAPDLTVRDAWIRAASLPEGGTGRVNSAAYMTIENHGDVADRLIEVGIGGFPRVELHESFVDDQGLSRMRRVDSLEIPSSGVVRLEPGGYHVMLIGLERQLEPGDSVTVVLRFDLSGRRSLIAEVRSIGYPPQGREEE